MSVRKLRSRQLGPWCSRCGKGVARAKYQGVGFTLFACEAHLPWLCEEDAAHARRNPPDYSDAAFQLRLTP